MPNILLNFETKNERDQFAKFLQLSIDTIKEPTNAAQVSELLGVEEEGLPSTIQLFESTLKLMRKDAPIRSSDERRAAIFVSGQKLAEGNITEMNVRFAQEIGVHSANVRMLEDMGDGGGYSKTIRSRVKQS